MRTIIEEIIFKGFGLHSGKETTLILKPSTEGNIRINDIEVNAFNVLDTYGMTTLNNVSQIEHLMSALYALKINSLLIFIDKNELPILDGCCREYIDKITDVGIKEIIDVNKEDYLYIHDYLEVNNGDSYIKFYPSNSESNKTIFECTVDFPYVGIQKYTWDSENYEDYYNNLSNALTFFWDKQYMNEVNNGRCIGLNKDTNCLVYNENSELEENALVRHKLLDFIGDINVLNVRIPGKFVLYKPGHTTNHMMSLKIDRIRNINKIEKIDIIPYFKFNSLINKKKIKDDINNIIDNNSFINSKEVKTFEDNLRNFIGCKYVLSVNSGTSALQVSIMALNLPKNSIIVTQDITFWATYEAIKLCGHKAIIINVDKDYQICLNDFKSIISKYDVKCLLLVHLYGFVSKNINELRNICEDRDIKIVEDGSHCLGSKYNREYILKSSYVSGCSMYPTKILGSCGNSGFITTNDDKLYERLLMVRDNGRKTTRYDHYSIGGNFIINSMQAVYCDNNLKNFDRLLNKLRLIYNKYKIGLCNLSKFEFLEVENCEPNGYMAILKLNNENDLDKFIEYMKKNKIDVKNIYNNTISNQEGFCNEDIKNNSNISYNLCKRTINLPIYYDLNGIEQDYIINKIKEYDIINIGIIGLGHMGKNHLNEINKNSKFNCDYYYDPYIENHDTLKRVKSISEFNELNIDFVIISSNTEYHYDCILECIKSKINFLVEKPMLIDYDSHKKINGLLQKDNIISGVGLCERYNKIFEGINKENIKKIIINRYCKIPSNKNTKYLLFDLAIHDFDILQYIFKTDKMNINDVKYNSNEYNISLIINNINVELNIGYREKDLYRNYTFIYNNGETKFLNLLNSRASLQDEHNDFIKLLYKKDNRVCNINESLNTLKNLLLINNKSNNDIFT